MLNRVLNTPLILYTCTSSSKAFSKNNGCHFQTYKMFHYTSSDFANSLTT